MHIDPRANRRRALLKAMPELGAEIYRESLRDEEEKRVQRYYNAGQHIGNVLAFFVWIVKLPFAMVWTVLKHLHEAMLLAFLCSLVWIMWVVMYMVGITKGWW